MKHLAVFALLFLFDPAYGQTKLLVGNNDILLDLPEDMQSENKLVVIAPAKKYTMEKPLFSDLATRLAKEGYIAARFNWSFVKLSTEPSSDLAQEGKELDKVISFLQKKYPVTKSNTYLVAKSFGSRVLMMSKIDKAGHVSLMTPNCSANASFKDTYAPLFNNNIRVNINISIDDPYCNVGQIYDYVSAKHRRITLFTTYGDHNFKVKKFSRENQELILLQIINWIKQR